MIKKSIIISVLAAILWMQNGYCQTETIAAEKQRGFSKFVHNDKLAFKFNYFGELGLHPGLEIGTDYTIVKRKWITVHWDNSVGGYFHRWNNTSVFIGTSIGTRLPIWTMFIDLNIGVAYMHSFAAGKVYQRAEDGGVEKALNLGHAHFKPSVSALIGWDGTRRNDLPVTIFLGPEIYLQSNFNHTFLPHVAVKLGLTYKFKNK